MSTFLGLLPWIFLTCSGFGKSGFILGVSIHIQAGHGVSFLSDARCELEKELPAEIDEIEDEKLSTAWPKVSPL